MHLTLDNIITDMKEEFGKTQSILDSITDSSLNQKVWDEGRTLGFLAWHLVLTQSEMGSKTGLKFEAPPEDSPMPTSAKEIVDVYKQTSANLLQALGSQWTDESLEQEVEMYGQKWNNIKTLMALIRHEIHHRAQLTVLMRQAGLSVKGMYGPAKEEWAQFGMDAMP